MEDGSEDEYQASVSEQPSHLEVASHGVKRTNGFGRWGALDDDEDEAHTRHSLSSKRKSKKPKHLKPFQSDQDILKGVNDALGKSSEEAALPVRSKHEAGGGSAPALMSSLRSKSSGKSVRWADEDDDNLSGFRIGGPRQVRRHNSFHPGVLILVTHKAPVKHDVRMCSCPTCFQLAEVFVLEGLGPGAGFDASLPEADTSVDGLPDGRTFADQVGLLLRCTILSFHWNIVCSPYNTMHILCIP